MASWRRLQFTVIFSAVGSFLVFKSGAAGSVKDNGTTSSSSILDADYKHSTYLDSNETILLRWSIVADNSTSSNLPVLLLVAQITTCARGYVGFGFSRSGGMSGADIILMWVDALSRTVHVQDRYAAEHAEPLVDADQTSLTAYDGSDNDTHSTFRFARRLNAGCFDENDLNINKSAVRIIYAFSATKPSADGHAEYHGSTNRGSATLYLLDDMDGEREAAVAQAINDTTSVVEYRVFNFEIPAEDATHWCQFFQLPADLKNNDTQIVAFEPIIQPNSTRFLRHFALHLCDSVMANPSPIVSFPCDLFWQQFPACFRSPMYTWAAGGTGLYLPRDIGVRTRRRDAGRYVLLDLHYNNPEKIDGLLDNSGLRLRFTTKLRPNLGRSIFTGSQPGLDVLIPGQAESFTIPTLCSSECSEKHVPENGSTIFAVLFHANRIGQSMILRHFRNDVELRPVLIDTSYDVEYQQWRPVNITFLRGDHFIMECTYSSMDRNASTLSGWGTKEEACFAYLYVTPPITLSGCLSFVEREPVLQTLNITETSLLNGAFPWAGGNEDAVRTKILTFDWTADTTSEQANPTNIKTSLQNLYLRTNHIWLCTGLDGNFSAGYQQIYDYSTAIGNHTIFARMFGQGHWNNDCATVTKPMSTRT